MAMMGSRKPTLRNLAAETQVDAGRRSSSSSSQRAGLLGVVSVVVAKPPSAGPTKRGIYKAPVVCRYNPERGVGVLAAVVDPAAARLRVAEPARPGARGIMEVTPGLCSDGFCTAPCRGRCRPPFRVAALVHRCNLCRRRIGAGCPIYMYKEMAFCEMECRYDYAMGEQHREKLMAAKPTRAPEPKRVMVRKGSRPAPAERDGDEGCMFFICPFIA